MKKSRMATRQAEQRAETLFRCHSERSEESLLLENSEKERFPTSPPRFGMTVFELFAICEGQSEATWNGI
jgi:hypothetical protein